MTYRTARIFSVILLIVIGAVNAVALWKHLYFYIPWLDLVMHAAGGFFVGFSVLTFSPRFFSIRSWADRVFIALAAALWIGLFWEIFEYATDTTFALEAYLFELNDALSDLIMDFFGGVLAGFVAKFKNDEIKQAIPNPSPADPKVS